MKSINVTRVVLGGLVASVVVFVVAGVLPGLILARDLQAWQQSLGSLSTPAPRSTGNSTPADQTVVTSGCTHGERYGRRSSRLASSSRTTTPFAWSHSS